MKQDFCTTTPQNRIEWIDAVKAFAILLMIFGHTLDTESKIFAYIYSFHMPLFIIVSGFFYKDVKFCTLLSKNIKGLLFPYALTLFFQYIINIILLNMPWDTALRKYFFTMLSGISIATIMPFPQAEGVGVLWFLPMLFLLKVLFWGITRISRGDEKLRLLLILLSVMCGLYLGKTKYWFPWSADIAFVAVIFFYAGFILQKKQILSDFVNQKAYIALCLFLWMAGIFRGITLKFIWRNYKGEFTCIIVAIAGSLVCCALIHHLCKLKSLQKILSWIGQGSLIILCLHHLERQFIPFRNIQSDAFLFLAETAVILSGYLLIYISRRLCKTALTQQSRTTPSCYL